MLKFKVYVLIAIVGIIALLAVACGQPAPIPTPAPTPSPSPTLSGSLTVYVTDAPPRDEVTSIMVTVSEVQVHKAAAEPEPEPPASDNQTQEQEQEQIQAGEGEWISISLSDNATTFDLLEIKGIKQYLGASEIAAGKYTQVRLVIDNIQVRLGEGELQEATVPSKEIKIVRPFDIIAGEATAMILDFDADRMVTVTGAGKIIVKPVIKLTVRPDKPEPEGEEEAEEEEPEDEAEEQAAVEVSCADFADDQHINAEVAVAVGDSFKIALCSDQTTGFQWSESAQIDDETIVEQTEHIFISPEEQPTAGDDGQEVWTFHALQEGTTTVNMEYSQPGEDGIKAERTFTLTLVVE